MNKEILFIITQLKDAYKGEPWFGRSIIELLEEVKESDAFIKWNDQHSMLELLWHINNWREFTIYSLEPDEEKSMKYFEQNDWLKLDMNDKSLWAKGLIGLAETQHELINILQKQNDAILDKIVPDRKYNFRKLLHGLIQHHIYHLGQIAYLNKMLLSKEDEFY